MPVQESGNLQTATEILNGLAKVRSRAGAWRDSESEEQKRETQVFKIGECLRPFYEAARRYPERSLSIAEDILGDDTAFFFRHIKKEGFFPSPYSPIPENADQYTDFAAFVLEFAALAQEYWSSKPKRASRQLSQTAKEAGQQAFAFLTTPSNYQSDARGCRWAGTNKHAREKKRRESYTDTYFTSVVALALYNTLEHPVLGLPIAKQDNIRHLIRSAGRWVVDRFDGQFLTGDESKTNRKLIHTTWGLRFLAETHAVQEAQTKKKLAPITNAYLDTVKSRLKPDADPPLGEQEYLTILSEDVDTPLYYEDRSGLGGILLTLVSLRSVPDLERLLDDIDVKLVTEQVAAAVFRLRNQQTGLWYNDALILSIHFYLFDAFSLLDQRGKGFIDKLSVSGHIIRSAVHDTLMDDAVLATLEHAVYQRVLTLVDAAKQNHALAAALELTHASSENKPVRKRNSK